MPEKKVPVATNVVAPGSMRLPGVQWLAPTTAKCPRTAGPGVLYFEPAGPSPDRPITGVLPWVAGTGRHHTITPGADALPAVHPSVR